MAIMAEQQNRALKDQFMLRLPDGMRDRIRTAAETNNRSMNAEIVATLEEQYPDQSEDLKLLVLLIAKFLAGMSKSALTKVQHQAQKVETDSSSPENQRLVNNLIYRVAELVERDPDFAEGAVSQNVLQDIFNESKGNKNRVSRDFTAIIPKYLGHLVSLAADEDE
ncbi:Arc family DNA-binding protein [Marinibacterium sp. SX1]|uniref:Arc family DNA-binding protein n=1 Tax=Marinibacterium sp. SX1 TaxID=3388424 RepID=UPI003D179295